ncbi:MAG: flagellar hook-associated protein 3, partial [Nitrosomonas sp.]|nr:flagellar hook-associated protein 3 [Nitrosomonas sp.]
MRISTATIYEKGLNGIQEQQAALINTQQQISSGRRMLSPSDDPIAAAQAINITQTLSLNNQFSINRDNTASTLGLVDNVLEGITSN